MKVLLDINVILDVLLERDGLSDSSAMMMAKVELKEFEGLLCATTLTTIHYLACKSIGKDKGAESIKFLLQIYEIAPVNRQVLARALDSDFTDYEDAVQHFSALASGAQAIVTRNVKDFVKSEIPVYTPEEFIWQHH